MDAIRLSVTGRTQEENVKALRRSRVVPGVVYGNKMPNTLLKCGEQDLHRAYVKAGESTIVELELDGKNVPVLIHSVSFDPVTDRFEHVDFYALDMTKKVKTHVPLHLEGEAPAVKGLGAILVTVHSEVLVSCLPKDLPHNLPVDLTKLENFHDTITVANLAVPHGVTIEDSPETVLITVQEPRAVEEEIPVAAAIPAEGEAAAPGAEGAEATKAEGAAPASEKKEEKKK
jgi:large subunit ribosomal protein L25